MSAITREAAALIRAQRWAALATLDEGQPLASMVAYAFDEKEGVLLFFLSQLAQHTRNMLASPQVSLAISEPDEGEEDPQRLQRVTLAGTVETVARNADTFHALAQTYVDRFPDALPRFELGDFHLFRFTPIDARYVGGFARASRFTWEQVREALGGL
jgi:putative heme iron utilization protein